MKDILSSACGGGGRVKFTGAKKRPVNIEELNMIIAQAVTKAKKLTKKAKAKDTYYSQDEAENFKYENSTLERTPIQTKIVSARSI